MSSDASVDAKDKLWSLIKDIRIGMLTTRDAHGNLHARPMTTQNSRMDEDRSLWFFMSRQGETATELATDASACMVYVDPDKDTYVSVSGSARSSDDKARKQQLWSPMAKAWFAGGVDDPDLLLIRFDIAEAEYWDVKESKVVQLWRMARASASGGPPPNLGEHAHVQMR